MRNSIIWIVFVSLFIVGCDNATSTTAPQSPITPAATFGAIDTSPNATADISEEEALEFADAWSQAIWAADQQALGQLVLWHEIARRAVDAFDVNEKFRDEFVQGVVSVGAPRLGQQLSMVAQQGSYEFVSAPIRDGQRHVVFRLLLPDGGLNYHDFLLARRSGRISASHLYVAATGEEFADTFRTMMGPMMAADKSILARMSGQAETELKAVEDLSKIRQLVAAGDHLSALVLLDDLPDHVQKSKAGLLMRIMATPVEKESEYLAVIDEYSALYPGDPSLGLITLDAAVLRKDIENMQKLMTELKAWSGDGDLDLMHGGILASFGESEKANAITENVNPASFGIASAHEYKLNIALILEDHAETLKQLRVLRDDYGYEFNDLSTIEGFEKFQQSPEYQQW